MLPRSCIFAKYLYQNTSKGWECHRYYVTQKHFYIWRRNCDHTKGTPSSRTLVWSQILAKGAGESSNKVISKPDIAKPTEAGIKNTFPLKNNIKSILVEKEKASENLSFKLEKVSRFDKSTKNGIVVSESLVQSQTEKSTGSTSDTDKKTENIDLLKNIKEKLLVEGPQPEGSTLEPLKKFKGKILDLKKDDLKSSKQDAGKAAPKKQRKRVDSSTSSLERNFITPVKAMSDFLLKPSDLETLPKTKRRSPYEMEPPITVYWRKDVEAKALEVWGSKETLLKELLKRTIERKKYQQNIFTVKRRLRDYRRELGRTPDMVEAEQGLMGRSGKVVLTAVAINATNCLFKLFAWLYTGSHSMFSECIHSLADTINQIILAYGIHKSVQIADSYHPYGYGNMKYVASLISGVGIFCVGTGLSLYHGVTGLFSTEPMQDFYWAYFILCGSLVSEGATCLVALNSVRKGARNANMSVKEFISRGQDPSVNVVLLEDFAAVIGVFAAGTCMGLSSLTHSPIPDALGSLFIGGILGCIASFIIYSNAAALVGRSIPQEQLDKINTELESDIMIRAIHDVKGIDMGNYLVRYKAELDFDGRELTKMYLDKQELTNLLEEVKCFENIDQLEEFMLKHGESIVDMMGGEIDRIEMKLRKKNPEIRHCDLEVL